MNIDAAPDLAGGILQTRLAIGPAAADDRYRVIAINQCLRQVSGVLRGGHHVGVEALI